MKAIYIYPEDIGVSDNYDSKWKLFIRKFGWQDGTPWACVLLAYIETENG